MWYKWLVRPLVVFDMNDNIQCITYILITSQSVPFGLLVSVFVHYTVLLQSVWMCVWVNSCTKACDAGGLTEQSGEQTSVTRIPTDAHCMSSLLVTVPHYLLLRLGSSVQCVTSSQQHGRAIINSNNSINIIKGFDVVFLPVFSSQFTLWSLSCGLIAHSVLSGSDVHCGLFSGEAHMATRLLLRATVLQY